MYENLRSGERFLDELYSASASVIVNESKSFRCECVMYDVNKYVSSLVFASLADPTYLDSNLDYL